ncbi:MAG: hypothetical protein MJ201_01060 [Mycoplasmoidaceae bacterium]|nr:hypothetical protein [Mycoplasmoidaceae bacterium]
MNGSTLTGDTVKATEITHPDYYNKSVYEMLPDNLVTALKAPLNRVVNEYNGSD